MLMQLFFRVVVAAVVVVVCIVVSSSGCRTWRLVTSVSSSSSGTGRAFQVVVPWHVLNRGVLSGFWV